MKIIAFTGYPNLASSRFRIRQYLDYWRSQQIQSTDFQLKYKLLGKASYFIYSRFNNSMLIDLIRSFQFSSLNNSNENNFAYWLERDLTSTKFISSHFKNKKCLIEIDDLIPSNRITFQDNFIFNVSNKFLADYYCNNFKNLEYNKNLFITPTCVNSDRFDGIEIPSNLFKIGWTGYSGNFKYLYYIEDALYNLLTKYSGNVVLKIISDSYPEFKKIKNFEFIKWSEKSEVDGLRDISVGIMPLLNTDFDKGKGGFKLIQYLTMCKPVIATYTEMNQQVLSNVGLDDFLCVNENEWYEKLESMILRTYSFNEKQVFRNKTMTMFSVQENSKKVLSLFEHT